MTILVSTAYLDEGERCDRLLCSDGIATAVAAARLRTAGLAHVEVAWGLYLFSACILASLYLGRNT